jgi:hypothetical protein
VETCNEVVTPVRRLHRARVGRQREVDLCDGPHETDEPRQSLLSQVTGFTIGGRQRFPGLGIDYDINVTGHVRRWE